jgi:mono/diheme cytochrome c family protein
MKRLMLILTAGMLLAALGTVYAQEGQGEGAENNSEQNNSFAAIRGAAVYAEFCQACHGPQGEATGTGAAFAAITFNEQTARPAIEAGGAIMPAYNQVLTTGQINDLIAYMETWGTGSVPPLPEPNIHDVPEHVPGYAGDGYTGAVIYAKTCAGCHGLEGEGRGQPGFPAFEFTDTTAAFVRDDHVPAFGMAAGGPLSDQQIADLETYMASWQAENQEGRAKSEGINALIVVTGALAIVVIGGAYMSRVVATEQA